MVSEHKANPNRPLEVIILAAGKGSRMKSNTPKVLHQVGGKSLLGHVISASQALLPRKIHIVIGHGKDQIKAEFAQSAVNWVEQAEQLGTGHAVQQVMPHIQDDADVMMLTADVPLISPDTLHEMKSAMTAFPLTLLTAIVDDPTGLGRIERDGDGVCGIVEQKDCSAQQAKISEINSGIMCARAQQLRNWLSQIGCDNAQSEYYLTDIVALAYAEGNPIAAVHPVDNNQVEGINSRSQLAAVERVYQHQRAEQLMDAGVTILDPSRIDIRGNVEIGQDTIIDVNCVINGETTIGKNCVIAPNCIISDSRIGDGTTIHANSVLESADLGDNVNVGPFARLRPGTALADNVRIGNFVETKNAQFSKGAKANHLSYVGDATVGQETNIGAGVITCNYDGAYKHKTTIGAGVFVGSDSQLVAPVVIEDGATIGAGSTITSKVNKDNLAVSRSRQREISGWQRPTKEKK